MRICLLLINCYIEFVMIMDMLGELMGCLYEVSSVRILLFRRCYGMRLLPCYCNDIVDIVEGSHFRAIMMVLLLLCHKGFIL